MKVLIIDDSPYVLSTLVDVLLMEGFEPHEARSVDEALEHIEKTQFDTVVTDLMMSGKSGFELIKTLKDRKQLPKKLIVSTAGLDHALLREREAGKDFSDLGVQNIANAVLTKPYDMDALIDAIKD